MNAAERSGRCGRFSKSWKQSPFGPTSESISSPPSAAKPAANSLHSRRRDPARIVFRPTTSGYAVSGKGKVYSFVTYHRAWHPAYQDKTPYNVSLIDLDEGPRLISNVVGCKHDEVKIGMPVEIVYDDREEYTLPQFRPVE